MRVTITSVLVAILCITLVRGATIQWTGGAGNSLWNFAANWQGNVVPSSNDDVIIAPLGGVSVTVSQQSYARSVLIGGSGSYQQSLILLSGLTVGSGGVTVGSMGTLQISGNNNLPLASTGNVTAKNGGAIVYNSGDISGPGSYVISTGSTIVFSGTALKLIDNTDLVIYGTATIQPTSIQLANSGTIHNYGQLVIIGLVNIFANDNSFTAFYSYTSITYSGTSSPATSLTFQVRTFLNNNLVIQGGNLIVNERFQSTSTIFVPISATVTIDSGTTDKSFNAITGAGSVIVQGLAEFAGPISVNSVTVSDSGSVTLSTNSTIKTLGVSGTVTLNAGVTFAAGDITLAAGTIAGAGQLVSTGSLTITASSSGNTNSFIATKVSVLGMGVTTGPVNILLSGNGNLNVASGATLKFTATTQVLKQSGTPTITNSGTILISLNSGATFYSNLDHTGNGAINIAAGLVTFQADTVTAGPIVVGTNALLTISAATVTAGQVSGTGALNVTANPTPTSVFGDVALSYFGVENGMVQVNSLTVDLLEEFNGGITFANGSNNKATNINWYGGILKGNVKLAAVDVLLAGNVAQVLDGVTLTASHLTIRAGTNSQLSYINGAQIIAGN